MSEKPFSAASERNRDPILSVLPEYLSDRERVLEIGSGTGQHAVYFAGAMPHLVWQASDRSMHLTGIRAWLEEADLANTPPPVELDVAANAWPATRFDAVFSANTLHIMEWSQVQALFTALPDITTHDAVLLIYGPFNFAGNFTSLSNAEFDASLRARGAHMGIRNFEDVDALALAAGFRMLDDVPMPANNRLLVWQRR